MKIIAVCGAQGALFHKLKKHVVANVEPRAVFHTPKEEQWKANFEDIPFYRNLSQLSKNMKEDVDLIVGSPSCGHSSAFSYSRKKTLGKPKEDPTLNLFISSIQDIQPQMFVMENLPKLMDFIPQDEWEATFPEYNFKILCHSVSMFGNSQVSRKRLLLIGIKKSSKINKIPFEIFTTKKIKHCKELYKSLRQELNFKEDDTKTVSMYFIVIKPKEVFKLKK